MQDTDGSPGGLGDFVEVWNEAQGMVTPPHHRRIVGWLGDRWDGGDRELLLMAFRGAGKSTLVGLFCAWLLCRNPDLRILVLAADLALAKKMVRVVRRLIERHPWTRSLRPDERDQWAAEQFTVRRRLELRDPSMLARGIGSNLTGSRADVVVCDDVEVPRTSGSAPKREDLRARLAEVDFVKVPDGLTLYVGTPHSYYTIYADAPRAEIGEERPFLDGYLRCIAPVLRDDGASAWPERFTLDVIAARRAAGENRFLSQMLLLPVNVADGRLDPDLMVPYDGEVAYSEAGGEAVLTIAGRRMVSASCWWDPAYGARAGQGPSRGDRPGRGDGSVVAAVFTDAEGKRWLHRVLYVTADEDAAEDAATQQCRQVAGFVAALHLPSVTVEANGLGAFLPGILRREMARAGVAAAVVEARSVRPKDERILSAFDAVLAARSLHAHRDVWDTPFVREMREWRPGRAGRSPDDGLDAVSGCLDNEPVRLGTAARPPRPPDWRGGGVFLARTDFTA
ncbi:phage terminase large subunit [Arenibaculum sp.]|uniref:phage terminase large subunit n=1 Tax=Arenibaculum sp. TaxID=2865862 RepID=UPI002E128C29|nr:phage terminase large subunit [Arenibaculum sp.]